MDGPELGVLGDVMIIGRGRLTFVVVMVAWLPSSTDGTSLRRLLFMALVSPVCIPSEGPEKSPINDVTSYCVPMESNL